MCSRSQHIELPGVEMRVLCLFLFVLMLQRSFKCVIWSWVVSRRCKDNSTVMSFNLRANSSQNANSEYVQMWEFFSMALTMNFWKWQIKSHNMDIEFNVTFWRQSVKTSSVKTHIGRPSKCSPTKCPLWNSLSKLQYPSMDWLFISWQIEPQNQIIKGL